jgi:predicted regulator of Ras-like GTPase activity (Roadblock/LC7/MglB family)
MRWWYTERATSVACKCECEFQARDRVWLGKERCVKEQADKALKEMLDISTDVHRAMLFSGSQVLASNFPESLHAAMLAKADELASLGAQRAADMGSSPLTQLVIESGGGTVFLVREAKDAGMAVLATCKKDSRIGLVFYDMKTCIRDAQDEPEAEDDTDAGSETVSGDGGSADSGGPADVGEGEVVG